MGERSLLFFRKNKGLTSQTLVFEGKVLLLVELGNNARLLIYRQVSKQFKIDDIIKMEQPGCLIDPFNINRYFTSSLY